MERKMDALGMLDLMTRPGFCVKENSILKCNAAAEALLITPGTDVRTLLATGAEEYAAFRSGCLYLHLALGEGCDASVTRLGDTDVFLLEPDAEESELRVLSLAARELRQELSSLMVCTNALEQTEENQDQLARLSRSLHRMQRTLGNMSDAGSCSKRIQPEITDMTAFLNEVFEKAAQFVVLSGAELEYKGLCKPVSGLADRALLERAVLNILSNALKFTPQGGKITASLTHRGKMLQLQIQDDGPGISESILPSLFFRYLRQPGIEDSRYGLGLGMVLIRSAAAAHGGTVLIDRPRQGGTRVTLTLAVRQDTAATLHSPVMRVDYTGEQDHALIELSQVLPSSAYEK